MTDNRIQSVVIVGGGTSGWMSAALLSKLFGRALDIRVVESDEIGTVGVGEATIPQIRNFNGTLGLDENEFVRETQGSFKLGIQFVNWLREGHRYIHAFGTVGGRDLGLVQFYHYWLKLRQSGMGADLGAYTFNTIAALQNKFMRPLERPNSPLGSIAYAFHFDAGLYARFLRRKCEAAGVVRTEGKVVDVQLHPESGFVDSLQLASGERIRGDLYLDCSGFRGLLIEQALKTGYDDWSRWLPVNRALAVPCASSPDLHPYTRSTARSAGWQWRIPLQHRTGNGYVYCSDFISDDEAAATLLANLDGKPLADPRPLRFVTGMRKQFWNKNVVAIGLASGFLEPLESTSIHFVQSSLAQLVALFPDKSFDPASIAQYNRRTQFEFERSRDFIMLHYHATERTGPLWEQVRQMSITDTLAQKIELFRESAAIQRDNEELFSEISWMQVFLGQNVIPKRYHPMVDLLSDTELKEMVEGTRRVLDNSAAVLPSHAEYIAKTCAAKGM